MLPLPHNTTLPSPLFPLARLSWLGWVHGRSWPASHRAMLFMCAAQRPLLPTHTTHNAATIGTAPNVAICARAQGCSRFCSYPLFVVFFFHFSCHAVRPPFIIRPDKYGVRYRAWPTMLPRPRCLFNITTARDRRQALRLVKAGPRDVPPRDRGPFLVCMCIVHAPRLFMMLKKARCCSRSEARHTASPLHISWGCTKRKEQWVSVP